MPEFKIYPSNCLGDKINSRCERNFQKFKVILKIKVLMVRIQAYSKSLKKEADSSKS